MENTMQFAPINGIQVLSTVEIDLVSGGDDFWGSVGSGAVFGAGVGAVYGTISGGFLGGAAGAVAGAVGGAIGAAAGYLWG